MQRLGRAAAVSQRGDAVAQPVGLLENPGIVQGPACGQHRQARRSIEMCRPGLDLERVVFNQSGRDPARVGRAEYLELRGPVQQRPGEGFAVAAERRAQAHAGDHDIVQAHHGAGSGRSRDGAERFFDRCRQVADRANLGDALIAEVNIERRFHFRQEIHEIEGISQRIERGAGGEIDGPGLETPLSERVELLRNVDFGSPLPQICPSCRADTLMRQRGIPKDTVELMFAKCSG